ncbi:hypothetical protein [Frankia gtarii]|nr:hypothetical protein [Frankia gtarii]
MLITPDQYRVVDGSCDEAVVLACRRLPNHAFAPGFSEIAALLAG